MITVRLTIDELLEVDAYLVRQLRAERDGAKRAAIKRRIDELRDRVRAKYPRREATPNDLHAYTHDAEGRLVPFAQRAMRGFAQIDLLCLIAGLVIALMIWEGLAAYLRPASATSALEQVDQAEVERLKARIEDLSAEVAAREAELDAITAAGVEGKEGE
jgi:hypothetical protein